MREWQYQSYTLEPAQEKEMYVILADVQIYNDNMYMGGDESGDGGGRSTGWLADWLDDGERHREMAWHGMCEGLFSRRGDKEARAAAKKRWINSILTARIENENQVPAAARF